MSWSNPIQSNPIMPKKSKQRPKNPIPTPRATNDHKMCPILWDRNEFGITVLTMENASSHYQCYPMVYVPLRTFMQCGDLWSVLKLCTVFWEPPLYGIPRDHAENERIKGAYLIEFASDLAPICKKWARECIEQCGQCSHEASSKVFVQIVIFNEARQALIMDAISRHNLKVSICEATNACTD